MEKQLTFYFGDFDEEYILDKVKEIFYDIENINIYIYNGDEMKPYKSIEIAQIFEDGDLLGNIKISEKDEYLFEVFQGEKVLNKILNKAKKIKEGYAKRTHFSL